jgi:hypothetical protein
MHGHPKPFRLPVPLGATRLSGRSEHPCDADGPTRGPQQEVDDGPQGEGEEVSEGRGDRGTAAQQEGDAGQGGRGEGIGRSRGHPG